MQLGLFKPLGAAFLLPPGLLVLAAVLGLVLVASRRPMRRRAGLALLSLHAIALWLLSCTGFALLLHQALLPSFTPARPQQFAAQGVQAIVVLGGGVRGQAPEFGEPQLNESSWQRLRLGAHLVRASGLPLAVAGGVGWASQGTDAPAEAVLADRAARQWLGIEPRWLDDQSRDTRENADRLGALLARDGVRHVALVTHDWHMARAVRDFERAGLRVTPAPTGFVTLTERPVLRWVPSAQGLQLSALAWREWLALRLT